MSPRAGADEAVSVAAGASWGVVMAVWPVDGFRVTYRPERSPASRAKLDRRADARWLSPVPCTLSPDVPHPHLRRGPGRARVGPRRGGARIDRDRARAAAPAQPAGGA